MDPITVGLVSTLLGALIGGYGSYRGGIRGAEENFNFWMKQQRISDLKSILKNRKIILMQLKYIYDNFTQPHVSYATAGNSKIEYRDYETSKILFDKEWMSHLSSAQFPQENYNKIIINLFLEIEALERQSRTDGINFRRDITDNILSNMDKVKLIIDQYDNEPDY
jgi:hypothetical protein